MNTYNTRKMTGKISSIETLGLMDGPGVRTVVFLQGCLLRCRYCHNPETWEIGNRSAREYTPEQLSAFLLRYKSYMKHGGVTFSGGEPLLQAGFLSRTARILKQNQIHICLDTAGAVSKHPENQPDILELLEHTDLILLDIKATDPVEYQEITGQDMDSFYAFLELIQKKKKPLWLRHVVVPGLNNDPVHIGAVRKFAAAIPTVEKLEFLPYHTLGVSKYKDLGIRYPLEGTPELLETEIQYG